MRGARHILLILLGLVSNLGMTHADSNEPIHDCQSAREFITTKEYLEKSADVGLDQRQIINTAHEVSKGCTGAAERFTRAFATLQKLELGARTSVRLSSALAQKPDTYTDTFLGVLERAFLKEYLDLDLKTSVVMAEKLSTNYSGDVQRALEDFTDLTQYCIDQKYLGLAIGPCAQLASDVAKFGENFAKPMAPAFRSLYEFLVSSEGPKLGQADAARLAKNLMSIGPDSVENFVAAYRYASQNDSMKLPAREALKFAQSLAQRSSTYWAQDESIDFARKPAALPANLKTRDQSQNQVTPRAGVPPTPTPKEPTGP